jgi:hypothetical protein
MSQPQHVLEKLLALQQLILETQDTFSVALQLDLENGVAWLNDITSHEFHTKFPLISAAINDFMDLEVKLAKPQEAWTTDGWEWFKEAVKDEPDNSLIALVTKWDDDKVLDWAYDTIEQLEKMVLK